MRKLWIKKPSDRNGYSFWDTEVSDDENCLREDDFNNLICFVPESRYKHLESQVKMLKETNSELETKVDELERELEQQRFNNKHNLSIDQGVADRMAMLESQNKIMKEALEFYAAIKNWHWGEYDRMGVCNSDADKAESIIPGVHHKIGGKRAREALRKLEEMK
jgi:hypothetical protein